MLNTPNQDNLNRIVVLNPKGGCGKTTLATNIASYYAKRGPAPTLIDCDPQGSSTRWLSHRDEARPPIHGIAAFKKTNEAARSWQLRVPGDTENLIIDSPASIDHERLCELTKDTTSILVPVLPSSIDIHATLACIRDLLLIAKVDRRDQKLAVVANRTRYNSESLDLLFRFLDSLGIPIIAVMRDSLNFVRAAEQGIGVCDLPPHKVRKDMDAMNQIIHWLDTWQERGRRKRKRVPSTVADYREGSQAQSN